MARFADTLVQDGLATPIDVIVDPDEGDLIDARHRRLRHHWWAALRARQRLPGRGDLSASFLAEIDDYVMIVRKDGAGLRYQAYGGAIARAYGRDMTGRSLDEFPSVIGQLFRSVYRLCAAQRVPVFTRHKPPPAVKVDFWLRLIVPLGEASPDEITHFLVCNVPVGETVAL